MQEAADSGGQLMAEITVEELTVLRSFAARYGRNWKAHLRWQWEHGYDDYQENAATLRSLRNRLGPSWLARYTLREKADA
jgi:hypothetical protein